MAEKDYPEVLPTDAGQERQAGIRQVGLGVLLLVVGAVVAVLLVQAGSSTLAAFGYVLAVAGLVLVGNGLLVRGRARRQPHGTRPT